MRNNNVSLLNSDYLTASRTYETYLVSDTYKSKVFYIFNRDGLYYYVFDSIVDILEGNKELIQFDDEADLDDYLTQYELKWSDNAY